MTRPLFLYCNLTKSVYGNNTIMKAFADNSEKTLIECNPLQFYSLRSHLVDILEVTLTEWNKGIPEFNQDRPVIVTRKSPKGNWNWNWKSPKGNTLGLKSEWTVDFPYKLRAMIMFNQNE